MKTMHGYFASVIALWADHENGFSFLGITPKVKKKILAIMKHFVSDNEISKRAKIPGSIDQY